MIFLCCTFVTLIEKDGGIRPCEVLATCAYKVLHSTEMFNTFWKDKLSRLLAGIPNKLFMVCQAAGDFHIL
jgi:hypothetical protein